MFPQTATWTTKDKRKMRICDMEDRHLRNTIRMLQRRTNFAIEQGNRHYTPDELYETFPALILELERRKLTL